MQPNSDYLVPIVVEPDAGGRERSYDIYSRLLKDNIIFVTGEINMGVANTFIAQVLFLEKENEKKDIRIYINCYGGEVYAGLAMCDVIRYVKNPVSTINVGLAASAASLILASGTKGQRCALPNSYTLIHQPLTSIRYSQATDVEITAKHMIKLKKQSAEIIAQATGKTMTKTIRDMERDYWMNADETHEYGLIDHILEYKK